MKDSGRRASISTWFASKNNKKESKGRSNSTQLIGFYKNLVIGRMLFNSEVRKLPIRYLLSLKQIFDDMKFIGLGGRTYLNSFFPPFPSKAFDRAVAFAASQLKSDRRLYLGDFNITGQCRYRCRRCYRKGRWGEDLPLDVILEGIRQLQDLGACVLGITGGEPLLRGDLEKIIATVDNRSSTILYSSGDGLTRQRAGYLADCGLNSAIISIDHFDPKKHDHQRRYDGSFKIAVKAVETFSSLDVYTATTIIPSGEMIEEQNLLQYLECAREWGAHEVRIGIPLPSGKLLKSYHDGNVRLSRASINRIKKIQITANSKRRYPNVMAFPIIEGLDMFGCGAGYHYLAIENDGNVTPCVLVPMSFGNIRDESLDTIWRRMQPIFNRAGGACYISRAALTIFKEFMDGAPLPLSPEKSLSICRQVPVGRDDPLPMFYKKTFDYIGRQQRSAQVMNGGDAVEG